MYFAINSERVNDIIQRINSLARHYDDIHGRFSSLTQRIDMDVKNKEAVRIALRSLENDMGSIRRSLRKMLEILEDVLSEYMGAYRANRRDCDGLAENIAIAGYGKTGINTGISNKASFNEFIEIINNRLSIPVIMTTLVDTKIIERYGILAKDTDIEGNVPVLTWRKPGFK